MLTFCRDQRYGKTSSELQYRCIFWWSNFTRLNVCVKNIAIGNLWAPPAWRESSSPASSRSSLRRLSSACRAAFWPATSVRLCWQLASCACAANSCEESSCSLSWSRASSCDNYIEISPFLCLPEKEVRGRGLQFYTFFGISIGIIRRMIDNSKKITFYFLQNVWKCTVFFAFAFKVC